MSCPRSFSLAPSPARRAANWVPHTAAGAQQRTGQPHGQQPLDIGAAGARQLADGRGQGIGNQDQPDGLEGRQPGEQRQHQA